MVQSGNPLTEFCLGFVKFPWGVSPRPRLFAAHDLETLELQVASCDERRKKKAFLRVFELFSFFWIPEIDVFNLSCVVLTYFYRYTCCNLQFGSMARKTPSLDAVTYQSFTSSSLRVLENPLEGGSRLYQMILE